MVKNKPRTFVGFVIDKSGSMGSVRPQAIEGHNAQLKSIRDVAEGQDVFVVRTLFDYPEQIEISEPMPLEEMYNLDYENYVPRGSTALNDALGLTITELKKNKLRKKDAVLVVVITDGEENSSVKFSPSEIKNMIKDLESTGQWTFTYLGSNQNLNEVANSYGFTPSNTASYVSSSRGTVTANATAGGSLGTYFSARNTGATPTTNFYNAEADEALNIEETEKTPA